jgi:aspartate racemase
MKKIGIIGGAGPFASALLLKNIVQELYKQGCKSESEFPEILLVNHPFNITMCTTLNKQDDKPIICSVLQSCTDELLKQNVELLAIACNTFHLFAESINTQDAQLVHIAQATLEQAKKLELSRLLILGTSLSLTNHLYLAEEIECIPTPPLDQKKVDRIIFRILSGKILMRDALVLRCIIDSLTKKFNCDGVVLGCTELPVLNSHFQLVKNRGNKGPVVLDTLQILAQKLVSESCK